MSLLPEGLLELMQCPRCAGELTERSDPPALLCSRCAAEYPVSDGIPDMVVEEE